MLNDTGTKDFSLSIQSNSIDRVFSVKVFKSKVFDCVCLVFRHWGLKCSLKTVDGHRSRLKSINPRQSSCSPLLYLKPANLQSTSLKSTQLCFNNFKDYKDYKWSMMIHDHHLLLVAKKLLQHLFLNKGSHLCILLSNGAVNVSTPIYTTSDCRISFWYY